MKFPHLLYLTEYDLYNNNNENEKDMLNAFL